MKLLSRYATVCGLKIRKQWLLESFYPLPTTRYVTLHASSGMAAKNYPYYQEVVALMLHILHSQGIQIVQLGGKDDQLVNGCVDLRGKTDYHQSSYILRSSLCHVGNDSWLAHRAGEQGVPLVTLFGSTTAANHGAYHHDAAKTVFLESHRWGRKATFASQEQPQSIGLIPPEQVANAVLRLLGITTLFTHTTAFVGPLYQHAFLELIPNVVPAPNFCPELPITARMDIHFDENILANLLQTGRKVHIITRRAINLGLLGQFRAQVMSYSHEITPGVDEPTTVYTDTIRSTFPTNHAFFTRETDEKKVGDLRLTYLDHVVIGVHKENTKDDFLAAALVYQNRPDTPENRLDITGQLGHYRFKTNRYVLSAEKCYLSHAHLAANRPIDSMAANTGDMIDDPAFFKDVQHMLITHHP